MLTLINANRMTPLIGPIGLEYIAESVRQSGIEVEILDLGLADKPVEAMKDYFSTRNPELVGVTFRNAEDCFWPSADWFVPGLKDTVEAVRGMSDAPIVIGGVGFSIFAGSIFEYTDIDFGVCGDGETATAALIRQLRVKGKFTDVPGLIWRKNGKLYSNPPAWPEPISLGTARTSIDNQSYLKRGGQCGIETKRGCNRKCIYCADPIAKGSRLRLRNPSEVADEVQSLLAQQIDVLHLCDSEFNVPRSHAVAVCEEFNRRSLGDKIRWYAYLSPTPFDAELAKMMAQAGCIGINFTADSGSDSMLQAYRQQHKREDLAEAVKLCRSNNIAVMTDLLLGGPGETPHTIRQTIDFIKEINPDCAGAALGVRVYPGTVMEKIAAAEPQEGKDSNIRRKYDGSIDLFKPTFYISNALGSKPAELVRGLIGGDKRFFEPATEADVNMLEKGSDAGGATLRSGASLRSTSYNYNENLLLTRAIEKGERGAYWDILRKLRKN